MKFRHIALMLSATLWIGCGGSGDEPGGDPVSKDRPIVFSGSLSENQSETHARTRTDGPVPLQEFPTPEHGHTTFHVWSYKTKSDNSRDEVMKNYIVNWTGSAGSTTSNSSGWEYVNQGSTTQDIKYWDFSVNDYRFFGYSGSGFEEPTYTYPSGESELTSEPESVTLTCHVNAEGQAIVNSSSSSWPLFSKVWYKSGSAIAASVQPVSLEFLRPIARVRFMFTFIEGLSFTRKDLDDIEFCPTDPTKKVAREGYLTITYPLTGTDTKVSWTSSGTAFYNGNNDLAIDYYEDPGITVTDTRPEVYPNSPEHWYYVLPRKGSDQGSFTLSLYVGGGEPKTAVVPAQYMTWEPSHDYTYVFKITSSGGVSLDAVQVAINVWNTKAAVTHRVYNW